MQGCAFITGGGKGIGRGVALKFAEKGINVCINEIDEAAAIETVEDCRKLGVKACSAIADISNREQVEACKEKCALDLGPANILVNNAGVMGSSFMLADCEDAQYDLIFNVNVRGILNTVRAFAPDMKANHWGRIINATSMYGSFPQVGRGIYAASKAAVISMTKVMAAELAPYEITVNAYAPGTVKTAMTANSLKADKLVTIPLHRYAEPEDVSGLIAFLASDEASYITGTVIGVDGGCVAVQTPSRAWDAL